MDEGTVADGTTPWRSDFASVEEEHLRDALKATPAQRLAALEGLIELARRAGVSARSDEPPASP